MLPESCKGCKGCCTNSGVNIFNDENILFPIELTEIVRLRPDLYPGGKPFRMMRHKENGECIALDSETGICTIYDIRPKVCKDFERGSDECLSALIRLNGE